MECNAADGEMYGSHCNVKHHIDVLDNNGSVKDNEKS